ncbi:MAG TPA: SpoIIE family protein phosphatase [Acidimicrobiales bacterium]|nr:SpoIIE family protein phosphatase [Acidimicrobiales bacterium]
MSPVGPGFRDAYIEALGRYVADRDAASLLLAEDLGRRALGDGVGVLDVVELHHRAIGSTTSGHGDEALAFLLQSLVALDMATRSYVEAQGRLRAERGLLDQAQRLARVGSWELDLDTGAMSGSEELLRQIQLSVAELAWGGLEGLLIRRCHPEDVQAVRAALRGAVEGRALDFDARLVGANGEVRTYHLIGELERQADGRPSRLRGSAQDVTEQREAEGALAAAAAAREAAAREHRLAAELQASLLPERTFDPDDLDVATYYRAGVEGTQVGGDWSDVIQLTAGRTALVVGDVMGRGVQAAAVMGQLRTATRAYARLDLPPAEVLGLLDELVCDLGDDQIVTCVYAVYDAVDHSLTCANAGHLPPLLATAEGPVRPLGHDVGPPLGTGTGPPTQQRLGLPVGARVALYTDGLVERRNRELDAGITALATQLATVSAPLKDLATSVVDVLLPEGPDDDVALLLAEVPAKAPQTTSVVRHVPPDRHAVPATRRFALAALRSWSIPEELGYHVILGVSELVTNALLHGQPPIELRLRLATSQLTLEVHDAGPALPRHLRTTSEDEQGRGLQVVSLLADRWGTRPTDQGKSVWCTFSLHRRRGLARHRTDPGTT